MKIPTLFSALLLCSLVLSGCIDDWPQKADYRITLSLQGEDLDAYLLHVPFLRHDGDKPEPGVVLQELSQTMRVVSGEASFVFAENRTRLLIQGHGPAILEAHHTFAGGVREREAFFDWEFASTEVRRESSFGPAVQLIWDLDFSGGKGHTCWATGIYTADLQPQQQTALFENEMNPGSNHWSVLCA